MPSTMVIMPISSHPAAPGSHSGFRVWHCFGISVWSWLGFRVQDRFLIFGHLLILGPGLRVTYYFGGLTRAPNLLKYPCVPSPQRNPKSLALTLRV